MATESQVVEPLREASLDLAWSLWAECGISTWARRHHEDWSVELEPLLVLTALLRRHDPRLMREAVDWCVQNERFISLKQFRHVVTAERWPFKGDIAVFGATVGSHAGKKWPGVTVEAPVAVSLSGKSGIPDLRRPALFQLKLRAVFGVSTRAEIIRVMLTRPGEWSARQIADRVAYTRRQIDLDLAMLTAGGLVYRARSSSPATYTVSNPAAVVALTGPVPTHAPAWAPALRVVTGLLDAFEGLGYLAAPGAELRRRVRWLEPAIERAGLAFSPDEYGHDYVEGIARWSIETVQSLALGQPPALRPDALGGGQTRARLRT